MSQGSSEADQSRLQFADGKAGDAMRTIGEVAQALGIKQHVLRYWEQQFPMLRPLKRSGGRRYYRSQDVALVEWIDRLVNREGYTLKGARQVIADARETGSVSNVNSEATLAGSKDLSSPNRELAGEPDRALVERLRAIRDRLAGALETA